MKFTFSFTLAAFVLATSTIALPMRSTVDINVRPDTSLQSRAAGPGALTEFAERGITDTIYDFKRELEPADELETRFIRDDAEELYARSWDDMDIYTRNFAEDADALVERDLSSRGPSELTKRGEVLLVRDDLDGLVRRNFFSKLKDVAKKAFSFFFRRSTEEAQTLAAREVPDDLVKRNFFTKLRDGAKKFFGKIKDVAKKVFGGIKNVAKKAVDIILRRSPEEISARSEEELSTRMEETNELFERYYDEELDARSEDDFLYIRDYEFEDEY